MPLREILARFGFEVDSKQLASAQAQVGTFVQGLKALPGIVGGVAGILGLGAVKDQIDELAAASAELRKASIKSGVGFQEFQRLQYQTGLGTEQLSGLFRKLQQNMAAAGGAADNAASDFQDADGGIGKALGKKQAAETFKALNVELTDAQGNALSSSQIFGDLTVALAKIKDPAQKTAIAIRIFGRAGSDILPLLEKSPEAIAELGEQFDAFGGITDDARQKLAAYGKEQKAWKLATQSVKIAIVTELVPALTAGVKWLVSVATWIKKNVETQGLFRTAIIGVTVAMVALNAASIAAAAKTAIAWARAAFPFAVLLLVADDLIHFFKGDAKTATEDLINALFGIEAGTQIIADLRAEVGQWISELTSATSWLDKIRIALDGIANAAKRIGSLGLQALGIKKETADNIAGGVSKAANFLSPTEQLKNATNLAGSVKDVNATGFFSDFAKQFGAAMTRINEGPGAPVVKKPGPTNNTVTSSINVVQHISGEGAQDTADAAKDGIKGVVSDQRRADLAYLDVRK